ncbi:synaptonemal complex protein 3-like isoform X2 [Conger conger]|uniref:synaptonemal complex protein 3-like isoform X2 n=1 Tax=Conger conger TaxID=82655 RepID=UPI002A59C195|nr:synaptonemal complex protein 3-like isoform X2 [Conger conger]
MAAPKSKKWSVYKEGKTKKAGYAKFTDHQDSLTFSNGVEKRHGLDYSPEPVGGRKRSSENDQLDMEDISEGTDVTTMLDRFGADINKAIITKRKRLELFTKSSLKSSHQAIEQMWKTQQNDRVKLTDDYSTQFNTVFQQWDSDVQKSKDQDEKLATLFRQQQKMFQLMRTSQVQRLKSIKQLLDQYIRKLEELQKSHSGHHTTLQTELRQEMNLLQKKLLMDTQQQDIATVRKSLHTLLL